MNKLTPRELEIVLLLAQGQRQADIARTLCLSPRTVEAHVKNARHKTDTVSAFELAVKVAIQTQK